MDLIIPGTPDDVYTLPDSIILEENSFDMRDERSTLALGDGVAAYGDEIGPRDITISGKFFSPTRDAHKAFSDALAARCAIPNQRLRLESNSGYYMNLRKLKTYRAQWQPLADRAFSMFSITFTVSDPYWYSETEQNQTFSMSGSGTFTLDASSALRWASPVITITFPPGSLATATLRNVTDGGLQIAYTDSNTAGLTLVIDCMNGLATISGTNVIGFVSGEFLRILPQVNTFSYTGPAATINFRWRPRWL